MTFLSSVRCRKDGAHEWEDGLQARFCVNCYLVQPYTRGGPINPHQGRRIPGKRRVAKLSPTRKRECIDRFGLHCWYCARPVRETMLVAPDQLTIDHVIPRSRGGTNDLRNLVVACFACNHAKGDRLVSGVG